jgi:hypothetical protein
VREILILAIHLLVTVAKLLRPGGVRAVAAESQLLRHQLLISNRSRQRASSLTPATLLKFHAALVEAKYRRLFSSSPSPRRKPGPKGPSWLTFIAHAKDSLWSVDLFRCDPLRPNRTNSKVKISAD